VIEGETAFVFNHKDALKPIERKDGKNIMLVNDKEKSKRLDRNAKNIPAPRWVDCYYKRGDAPCG
jgi:hypothetical protein